MSEARNIGKELYGDIKREAIIAYLEESFFAQAGNRILVNGESSPSGEDYRMLVAHGSISGEEYVDISASASAGDPLINYRLYAGSYIGGPYTSVSVTGGTGTLIAYIKPEKVI